MSLDNFSPENLVRMLDEAMTSGDWHSVRIFQGLVSMGRDQSSFTVDQLVPEARPSEKLFWLLNANLRKPVCAETPQNVDNKSGALSDLLDDI